MFCPNCGRDNSIERKFCGGCGTNLEVVSQALSESGIGVFTRIERGLDQFIAKYSEHVFRNAPNTAADRRVSKSWQLLGQGFVTLFVDLIFMSLMWSFLPFRFLILLFSTPIRLLSERGSRRKGAMAEIQKEQPPVLPEPAAWQRLPGPAPSVSEHTTEHLEEFRQPRRDREA